MPLYSDVAPYMADRTAVPTDRELDAQVAEYVFDYWDVGMFETCLVHGESNMNGWPVETPAFSRSRSAAQGVIDELMRRGLTVTTVYRRTRGQGSWGVIVRARSGALLGRYTASHALVAVCRAAVQAFINLRLGQHAA